MAGELFLNTVPEEGVQCMSVELQLNRLNRCLDKVPQNSNSFFESVARQLCDPSLTQDSLRALTVNTGMANSENYLKEKNNKKKLSKWKEEIMKLEKQYYWNSCYQYQFIAILSDALNTKIVVIRDRNPRLEFPNNGKAISCRDIVIVESSIANEYHSTKLKDFTEDICIEEEKTIIENTLPCENVPRVFQINTCLDDWEHKPELVFETKNKIPVSPKCNITTAEKYEHKAKHCFGNAAKFQSQQPLNNSSEKSWTQNPDLVFESENKNSSYNSSRKGDFDKKWQQYLSECQSIPSFSLIRKRSTNCFAMRSQMNSCDDRWKRYDEQYKKLFQLPAKHSGGNFDEKYKPYSKECPPKYSPTFMKCEEYEDMSIESCEGVSWRDNPKLVFESNVQERSRSMTPKKYRYLEDTGPPANSDVLALEKCKTRSRSLSPTKQQNCIDSWQYDPKLVLETDVKRPNIVTHETNVNRRVDDSWKLSASSGFDNANNIACSLSPVKYKHCDDGAWQYNPRLVLEAGVNKTEERARNPIRCETQNRHLTLELEQGHTVLSEQITGPESTICQALGKKKQEIPLKISVPVEWVINHDTHRVPATAPHSVPEHPTSSNTLKLYCNNCGHNSSQTLSGGKLGRISPEKREGYPENCEVEPMLI